MVPGSGRYVNRVADLNDESTRAAMGKPFPAGDYVCAECDTAGVENEPKPEETQWPPLFLEHNGVKVYHCLHDDHLATHWFTTDPEGCDIDENCGVAQFDARDLPAPKESWPHGYHQRIVEAIEVGLATEAGLDKILRE